jgi:hypothetical protein
MQIKSLATFTLFLAVARPAHADASDQTPDLKVKLPLGAGAVTSSHTSVGPTVYVGAVLDARFLSRLGASAGGYFGPRLVHGEGGGWAWAAQGMARVELLQLESEPTAPVCVTPEEHGSCLGYYGTYRRQDIFALEAGAYVGSVKIAWGPPSLRNPAALANPEVRVFAFPMAGLRWYSLDTAAEHAAYGIGLYAIAGPYGVPGARSDGTVPAAYQTDANLDISFLRTATWAVKGVAMYRTRWIEFGLEAGGGQQQVWMGLSMAAVIDVL